jgi:hypothetical protein
MLVEWCVGLETTLCDICFDKALLGVRLLFTCGAAARSLAYVLRLPPPQWNQGLGSLRPRCPRFTSSVSGSNDR